MVVSDTSIPLRSKSVFFEVAKKIWELIAIVITVYSSVVVVSELSAFLISGAVKSNYYHCTCICEF